MTVRSNLNYFEIELPPTLNTAGALSICKQWGMPDAHTTLATRDVSGSTRAVFISTEDKAPFHVTQKFSSLEALHTHMAAVGWSI